MDQWSEQPFYSTTTLKNVSEDNYILAVLSTFHKLNNILKENYVQLRLRTNSNIDYLFRNYVLLEANQWAIWLMLNYLQLISTLSNYLQLIHLGTIGYFILQSDQKHKLVKAILLLLIFYYGSPEVDLFLFLFLRLRELFAQGFGFYANLSWISLIYNSHFNIHICD